MSSTSHSILAAAAGIVSCTVFSVMNTTLNYIAIPAYLLLPSRNSYDKSTSQQLDGRPESHKNLILRQWELTYSTGHLVGPASAIFSTLSFLYAAWSLPGEALQLRTWCFSAAMFAVMPIPFTVIWVLPTNDELYRRVDLLRSSVKTLETIDENNGRGQGSVPELQALDTLALVRKCHSLSKIRALMPVPAILVTMYVIAQLEKVLGR